MTGIASAIFSGCVVGPDFAPVAVDLPESYIAESGDKGVSAADDWFAGFNDPVLLALLDIARTNNFAVAEAQVRIRASRANLEASRAEFWPKAGFGASASKSKSFDPDATTDRASLGFDASWEIDLFGKTRRSVEAQSAELLATELSEADARLSLDAELAAEYINLRLRQLQYAIEKDLLELTKSSYEIAKSKYESGMVPERDILSAISSLKQSEASLPESEAQITSCIRRIEILCAYNPGRLETLLRPAGEIPAPPDIALTIPSALLRNRPDIRKAEANYAAALARIGVAKAAYYPSVSIGAGASLSSDSFSDWGDAVKSVNIGPSLNWTLLDFGRNKAKVEAAKANAEEAALVYRETVLKAVHEVEAAAVDLDKEIAKVSPITDAVAAQEKASQLTLKMYEEGLGEYQEVISARQISHNLKRTSAELQANITLAKIALYKSIGGTSSPHPIPNK